MANTQREGLQRLSYVRKGESVDTATGIVYRAHSDRPRGYVTERWMKAHGWKA